MKSSWIINLGLPVGTITLIQLATKNLLGEQDPLYHFHHAQLFFSNGLRVFGNFVWLPYSEVGKLGADLWWGYHILLSLFSQIAAPFVVVKIVIILTALFLLGTAYKVFKFISGIFMPFWMLFFTAANGDFLFRISVLRPQVLAITLLLLSVLTLLRRKFLFIFAIGVIWSVIEPSFVAFLAIVGLYALIVSTTKKEKLSLIFLSVTGVFIGLVMHPGFPRNIELTLIQYQTLILPLQGTKLAIGQELFPYHFIDLIKMGWLIILFWLVAIYLQVKGWLNSKQISSVEIWLLLLSAGSFLAMLRVRRFVDYWVPLATLLCVYMFRPYFSDLKKSYIISLVKDLWQMKVAVLIVVLVVCFAYYHNIIYVINGLKSSASPIEFANAAQWLNDNSQPGEIVFNTQWDQFPQLFYWDDRNYYIVGMDPTFLYEYDHDRYWQWRKISDDDPQQWGNEVAYQIIKQFKSSYVFIEDRRNPNLKNYLERDNHFEVVYTDSNIHLYKVK